MLYYLCCSTCGECKPLSEILIYSVHGLCNDIHLATCSLCNCAPITTSSRDRDIIASWAWQVGIRALPTLGAFAWSYLGRVESRKKNYFESSYILESRNSFYSLSLRRSGEDLWRRCFDSTTLLSQKIFLGSRGYFWDRYDIGVTEFCSWCLLSMGGVRGSWAPRFSCHIRYRFSSGIPEDADIKTPLYFLWWQIVPWLIPSTGGDSSDDLPWLVSFCFRRSEVHEFPRFLGYVLNAVGTLERSISC